MKKQGPTVNVDGKPTVLWYFTGKVLSSHKQKETQVSSQSYGTQGNPQVHVSSTTVDHHEFFLVDDGGKEESFKMIDFDFPCRQGQTLSVVWGIPQGAGAGPYLHVRNHNTEEAHQIDANSIAITFRKPGWMIWGSGLGLVIVTSPVLGPACMLMIFVPFFYFRWRSRKAAKGLLTGKELTQLDSELARIKPMAA
jgi:hypothetical protein